MSAPPMPWSVCLMICSRVRPSMLSFLMRNLTVTSQNSTCFFMLTPHSSSWYIHPPSAAHTAVRMLDRSLDFRQLLIQPTTPVCLRGSERAEHQDVHVLLELARLLTVTN